MHHRLGPLRQWECVAGLNSGIAKLINSQSCNKNGTLLFSHTKITLIHLSWTNPLLALGWWDYNRMLICNCNQFCVTSLTGMWHDVSKIFCYLRTILWQDSCCPQHHISTPYNIVLTIKVLPVCQDPVLPLTDMLWNVCWFFMTPNLSLSVC